jgi:predicted lipoprotein with Yx(FWY)xxD motif
MKTKYARSTPRSLLGVLATTALGLGAASGIGLSAPTAGATGSNQVVVSTMTIGKYGKVLVSEGDALYTLVPNGTPCGAKCLKVWPALTLPAQVKSATAGPGVTRSKLGVAAGPSRAKQVTYGGRALYRFFEDKKGQVKGDLTDQWGKWTAVVVAKPSQPAPASSNSGSGSTNAGSGGVSF